MPWRGWVVDSARAPGAPADYVAMALLAAVAAVCVGGVQARVAAWWSEPLVLRLALLGRGSSGRTPALARARGLLSELEAELKESQPDGSPLQVVTEAGVAHLDVASPAMLLWRDDETAGDGFADLPALASVLTAARPESLVEALAEAEPRWAAQFLFAWPDPAAYVPLGERRAPDDGRIRDLLRCLQRTAGSPQRPLALDFDPAAVAVLDRFLAGLHGEWTAAQGLQADWLGKGGAAVARLAAVVTLLDWSGSGVGGTPSRVPAAAVETAERLWRDYFRPHAGLVFERAGPTDLVRQARRVVHWLRAHRCSEVSREQVRRHALAGSVSAGRATMVLGVLSSGGLLRSFLADRGREGGRPRMRWEVNPLLLVNRPAETAECGTMLPQSDATLS